MSVFVGAGNLDVDNWRPRIEAVDHVLKSWHSRSLSFHGKALVVNALALSRVWYVASGPHARLGGKGALFLSFLLLLVWQTGAGLSLCHVSVLSFLWFLCC